MKVVITGASGFLGYHFQNFFPKGAKVIGTYSSNPPFGKCDFEPFQVDFFEASEIVRFLKMVQKEQPDYLIHLAALANPNYCQEHPNESKIINQELPHQLATFCESESIKFLFASTDMVFDGKNAPFGESEITSPISIYGEHKSQAERLVLSANPSAIIARLPLMFGKTPSGKGFFSNWVEKLKNNETIYAFTDEFRTPAWAGSVAKGIALLLEKEKKGIFHLGGKESLSRFAFAERLAKFLKIENPNIKPSLRADVTMSAPRPCDVSLICRKAVDLGYEQMGLEEAFDIIFESF